MTKTLYRDPKNGKLGGVCAGVAEYFGMEAWVVRILTVSAFLLLGFFVILAYVAACLFLDKMPEERQMQQNAYKEHTLKQKPWQSGQPPSQVLDNLETEMDGMESKLREMEAYVTSSAFNVEKAFKQL
ncbi:envelope stress response membrane protein PspC [Photobacterium sp. CCB-ST2H9]|uniref:envelope stress response membrane protein PspC n=1 Tax=unclassified Photobacterium TaxID=2628852 RepID=UPI00200535B4|nr:envelope stress response membrane protein PspC [Photobacterium sp. CCB-ST2H9]UTM56256.1 envelope stress response membrane protein PspC [Photobacterium sp. CCB-ST2H9]